MASSTSVHTTARRCPNARAPGLQRISDGIQVDVGVRFQVLGQIVGGGVESCARPSG